MTVRTWEPIVSRFCQYVNQQVFLEAEVVYPADFLFDFSPRVLAHRCSRGIECNLEGQVSCMWAGINPALDPFIKNT